MKLLFILDLEWCLFIYNCIRHTFFRKYAINQRQYKNIHVYTGGFFFSSFLKNQIIIKKYGSWYVSALVTSVTWIKTYQRVLHHHHFLVRINTFYETFNVYFEHIAFLFFFFHVNRVSEGRFAHVPGLFFFFFQYTHILLLTWFWFKVFFSQLLCPSSLAGLKSIATCVYSHRNISFKPYWVVFFLTICCRLREHEYFLV